MTSDEISPPTVRTVGERTNLLRISQRRPRAFYERAAKELFASGHDVVHLSALGDAISTAVELAATLEMKKTATIAKIETKNQSRTDIQKDNQSRAEVSGEGENRSPSSDGPRTAGICIELRKHPDFRGSRITPAHLTWAFPEEGKEHPDIFCDLPMENFASAIPGDKSLSLESTEPGILSAVKKILASEDCGQIVSNFQQWHQKALDAAWDAFDSAQASEKRVIRIVETLGETLGTTDVKAVLCRPCVAFRTEHNPRPAVGAVFVDIFDPEKAPYQKSKNFAMVYVAAPTVQDFPDRAEFLNAVRTTAANLMTALCDYTGSLRRKGSRSTVFKRLSTVRLFTFPEKHQRHPDVEDIDLAHAILAGLDSEYHYGVSPRLNLASGAVFKQAWIALTGFEAK